jgi:hypothetical protein
MSEAACDKPLRMTRSAIDPSAPPMRILGYCRVSTAEQADGGVSLDAQRQIAGYAMMRSPSSSSSAASVALCRSQSGPSASGCSLRRARAM